MKPAASVLALVGMLCVLGCGGGGGGSSPAATLPETGTDLTTSPLCGSFQEESLYIDLDDGTIITDSMFTVYEAYVDLYPDGTYFKDFYVSDGYESIRSYTSGVWTHDAAKFYALEQQGQEAGKLSTADFTWTNGRLYLSGRSTFEDGRAGFISRVYRKISDY